MPEKKKPLICETCFFHDDQKCSRNSGYCWLMSILFGSCSPTVCLKRHRSFSDRPASLIHYSVSKSSVFSPSISLSLVIVFKFVSCVIFAYCMDLLRHNFASCLVFSRISSSGVFPILLHILHLMSV